MEGFSEKIILLKGGHLLFFITIYIFIAI